MQPQIGITGEKDGRRIIVLIDKYPTPLTYATFGIFARLAIARAYSVGGWVTREHLTPETKLHYCYINRMRTEIYANQRFVSWPVYEMLRSKSLCRLMTRPERITISTEGIASVGDYSLVTFLTNVTATAQM